jgi:hypothetical protein
MYYWMKYQYSEIGELEIGKVIATETRDIPGTGWVEATQKAYDVYMALRDKPTAECEDVHLQIMKDSIALNIDDHVRRTTTSLLFPHNGKHK